MMDIERKIKDMYNISLNLDDISEEDRYLIHDWYNIVSAYIENGEIANENIISALRDFLIYYQQEFGFQLENVIKYISAEEFTKSFFSF